MDENEKSDDDLETILANLTPEELKGLKEEIAAAIEKYRKDQPACDTGTEKEQ